MVKWAGATEFVKSFGVELEKVKDPISELTRLQEEAAGLAVAVDAPARVVPAWEEAGFKSVEAFDKEMKKLAKVAAKEAEEAAAAATAALNARLKKDLPKINATILEGFAEDVKWRKAGDEAGQQFAAGVFTGWASGPKALESTELAPAWLMDRMMKAGPVAGNAMSEAVVGQMAGPEAASAWDRAGGFTGMFTGMTGAVSAFATGGWKGGVMSIVNTAASLLPPGMAQAAQVAIAAFGAVWKAIKRPSEEEIAARKSFAGIHASAVETFGETAAYTESVQRLVAEGWDRTLAETVVGFEQAAASAGVSHAEAVSLYDQYQRAVQDGNTELVASIEKTYGEWVDAGKEASDALTKAAEEAAQAQQRFLDQVSNAAVSAYDKAQQEGKEAYQEVMDIAHEYHDAVREDDEKKQKQLLEHHGEWIKDYEKVQDAAAGASADANKEIMDDERDKYVRLAVFEATLAAIRSGNAEGAAAAARLAAQQTTEAWEIAWVAIEGANEIANDTMEMSAEELAAANKAAATESAAAATESANHSISEAGRLVKGVNAELAALQRRVDIEIRHHTTYSSSGSSKEKDPEPGRRWWRPKGCWRAGVRGALLPGRRARSRDVRPFVRWRHLAERPDRRVDRRGGRAGAASESARGVSEPGDRFGDACVASPAGATRVRVMSAVGLGHD